MQQVFEAGFADSIGVARSLINLTKVNSQMIATARHRSRLLVAGSIELEYEIKVDPNGQDNASTLAQKVKGLTPQELVKNFKEVARLTGVDGLEEVQYINKCAFVCVGVLSLPVCCLYQCAEMISFLFLVSCFL
jgi:hypothetical protein